MTIIPFYENLDCQIIDGLRGYAAKPAMDALLFFNAFILWNNEAVEHYTCMTFDMRDSTSYADPGLKMWDTFALASVLTLKSNLERPSQ
jgi:hypothetical protein